MSKDSKPPKIIGIGGSLNPKSMTYLALNYASAQFHDLGVPVDIIDLREVELPFCGSSNAKDNKNVELLKSKFFEADGIILATPEYHGGPSGIIKNALDLLSFEQLAGKVFGTISVLGGQSNNNALNQLRHHIRWVHGWTIPSQLAIGQAYQAFDESGNIIDTKLQDRFRRFAQLLIESTCKLRDCKLPDKLTS